MSTDPFSTAVAAEDADDRISRTAGIGFGLVVLPVAVAVWGAFTYGYSRLQHKYWYPFLLAAALGVVLLPTGWILPVIGFWISGYTDWFNAGMGTFFMHLPRILLGQVVPGLFFGSLLAGGLNAEHWFNRPKNLEVFLTPTWFDERVAKHTAHDIAQDKDGPDSGITVGIARDTRDGRYAGGAPGEQYGHRVVLAEKELVTHTIVTGGSGAGKTTAMLIGVRDLIRQGIGVVYIDCKGGPDVPEELAKWADRYGRTFLHWSMHDSREPYLGPADAPAFYDPLSRGNASRHKDLLIESQEGAWQGNAEYFKSEIARYLQVLFNVRELVPPLPGVDTLQDVSELLAPKQLLYRARNIDASRHTDLAAELSVVSQLDNNQMSAINNMRARIETLRQSVAGPWMRLDPEGQRDVDLRRVIDEGQVVVFSLDSSNYEAIAKLLAGLVVQDLKTLSSELRTNPARRPMHIYLDEFAAVRVTNLLGLLNKARDAKLPCTVSTQALADLARDEKTFGSQVLAIVSSFVILRANTEEDARVYAGLSGLRRKIMATRIPTSGRDRNRPSDLHGSYEQRDDWVIHPGVFQDLEVGTAVVIVKSPTNRYVNYVEVVREDPMLPSVPRGVIGPQAVAPAPIAAPAAPPMVTPKYPHPAQVELDAALRENVPFAEVRPDPVVAPIAPPPQTSSPTPPGFAPIFASEISEEDDTWDDFELPEIPGFPASLDAPSPAARRPQKASSSERSQEPPVAPMQKKASTRPPKHDDWNGIP